MRKMKRVISVLMAVSILLCASALAEAEDPVVVRVGDFSFTKSQLQSAIDTDIEFTELLSQETLTDEERQAQRDDTIERFIGVGLIQCKL
ncbi:MAG: hypothetical protein IJ240_09615, partial [Clostridia bacterium]|nr:hypothetical protein [Clostridia bacterium]